MRGGFEGRPGPRGALPLIRKLVFGSLIKVMA